MPIAVDHERHEEGLSGLTVMCRRAANSAVGNVANRDLPVSLARSGIARVTPLLAGLARATALGRARQNTPSREK
jgi:hypothetical protein